MSQAGAEALRRAAEYIASAIRHAAPSARTAASWVIRKRGDAVVIHTDYIAEYMSETNHRHPYWGDREHWAAQNVHHPERTGAAERAMYEAANRAGNLFLDDYLERIAIDSPYLNRGY